MRCGHHSDPLFWPREGLLARKHAIVPRPTLRPYFLFLGDPPLQLQSRPQAGRSVSAAGGPLDKNACHPPSFDARITYPPFPRDHPVERCERRVGPFVSAMGGPLDQETRHCPLSDALTAHLPVFERSIPGQASWTSDRAVLFADRMAPWPGGVVAPHPTLLPLTNCLRGILRSCHRRWDGPHVLTAGGPRDWEALRRPFSDAPTVYLPVSGRSSHSRVADVKLGRVSTVGGPLDRENSPSLFL